MSLARPSRPRASTIVRSSNGIAFAITLLMPGAYAYATPPERDHAGEAPPPHLRRPVTADGDAVEHAQPALADPASASEVSLDTMLAYADAHSPVLLVARSTRSRAEAAHAAASPRLPANPELSIALGPRIGSNGIALDVDISFMQRIQISGERGRRVDAAERLADLTDADIEQIRWEVHCEVHAAFHRTLVERERARLAARVVAFQQDVLRVVERQIAAGETAPLSLRLAEAEVAQANQILVATEQAFLASRIRLGLLAGWPATRPPEPSGDVDIPRDPPAHDALVAAAREHLPRLRVGAAAVLEAEARVAAATRARVPQPSIGIQYQRESNPAPDTPYHVVMGVISIPITSFQRNQGERAEARADAIVAEAELEATRMLLEGRIAEARSEVAAAAQRTRAYGNDILPRFEENLALLRRSFELGEIDILSLSVGRERFLRIQSDALGAQLDYFIALAGLERTVGVDLWHDDHDAEPSR